MTLAPVQRVEFTLLCAFMWSKGQGQGMQETHREREREGERERAISQGKKNRLWMPDLMQQTVLLPAYFFCGKWALGVLGVD